MCRVKVEKVETINNKNLESVEEENRNGVSNCILLFFIFICIQLVTENYISYGILVGPLEIVTDLIQFLDINTWIFLLLLSVYGIQFFTCFFVEKSLALNYVSENIGLFLHILNNCLLVSFILVLFPIIKPNPVMAHMCVGYSAFPFFKFFSYITENKISRQVYRNSEQHTNKSPTLNNNLKEDCTRGVSTISYPKSVTMHNLFEFMVCTGNLIYSPKPSLNKTPKKLKQASFALLYGILIHYACAFISLQYIIPEMDAAKSHFTNQQYLNLMAGIGKMIIPVNTVWLLFYHFWCMQCFFPMHGWFWGTKNDLYNLDWWNSKNMTVFWTKWNNQVHKSFKKYIFAPMLERGYGKYTASLVVACASGILHEYFISLPFRSSFGLAFMAYVIQIPVAIITNFITKKFGTRIGNILVLAILSLSYTVAVNVLYINYTT